MALELAFRCGPPAPPDLIVERGDERRTIGEKIVVIGDRLRALRRAKSFSQYEIEDRAGLLRHYLSDVENGETIPTVETLESIAWALEVPLYELFYDGEEPPALKSLPNRLSAEDIAWGGAARAIGGPPLVSSAVRSHRQARPSVWF